MVDKSFYHMANITRVVIGHYPWSIRVQIHGAWFWKCLRDYFGYYKHLKTSINVQKERLLFTSNKKKRNWDKTSSMRLVCYPFSFNCLKGIHYSMLPWVCSVIDRRRCQNVVRTKVAFEPQASVSLMYLPYLFDIICDLLLNICTATWNLFVKLAMELVVL